MPGGVVPPALGRAVSQRRRRLCPLPASGSVPPSGYPSPLLPWPGGRWPVLRKKQRCVRRFRQKPRLQPRPGPQVEPLAEKAVRGLRPCCEEGGLPPSPPRGPSPPLGRPLPAWGWLAAVEDGPPPSAGAKKGAAEAHRPSCGPAAGSPVLWWAAGEELRRGAGKRLGDTHVSAFQGSQLSLFVIRGEPLCPFTSLLNKTTALGLPKRTRATADNRRSGVCVEQSAFREAVPA